MLVTKPEGVQALKVLGGMNQKEAEKQWDAMDKSDKTDTILQYRKMVNTPVQNELMCHRDKIISLKTQMSLSIRKLPESKQLFTEYHHIMDNMDVTIEALERLIKGDK